MPDQADRRENGQHHRKRPPQKAIHGEGRREEQHGHEARQAFAAGLDDHCQRQRHRGGRGAEQNTLHGRHLFEPEVEERRHRDQNNG